MSPNSKSLCFTEEELRQLSLQIRELRDLVKGHNESRHDASNGVNGGRCEHHEETKCFSRLVYARLEKIEDEKTRTKIQINILKAFMKFEGVEEDAQNASVNYKAGKYSQEQQQDEDDSN